MWENGIIRKCEVGYVRIMYSVWVQVWYVDVRHNVKQWGIICGRGLYGSEVQCVSVKLGMPEWVTMRKHDAGCVGVTYNMYEWSMIRESDIQYVRVEYDTWEWHTICTNGVWYVRVTYNMYEWGMICESDIQYVRMRYGRWEWHTMCTNEVWSCQIIVSAPGGRGKHRGKVQAEEYINYY